MKILITGAGGMVGRNLIANPRRASHDVLAPSRAEVDLTDRAVTAAFIDRHRPDLIINAAGLVGGIQANMASDARFLAENLAIGLNVLTAAARSDVPRLINLGSSCMYPKDLDGSLTEDLLLSAPLEPTNEGYALAKIATCKLTTGLGRDGVGRTWRTLIPCNLYGEFDHYEPSRSHMVAAALAKVERAVRDDARTVEIWGDGEARREFLFAGDLADFIWRFHDRLADLPEVMNVGVGEDVTINDYYRACAVAVGYRGGFSHDLARPVGMRRKRLDVSAQSKLGWRPPTPMAAGLLATVADLRRQYPNGA